MATHRLLLGSVAHDFFSQYYTYAIKTRKMNGLTAFFYAMIRSIAFLFLRLEGPSWTVLRTTLRPWFVHLNNRPYQFLDPLRYLLQLLWIIFVAPFKQVSQSSFHPVQTFREAFSSLNRVLVNFVRNIPLTQSPSIALSQFSTVLTEMSQTKRTLLYLGMTGVCLPLFILVVTQPFSLPSQAIFFGMLWMIALAVRRIESRYSILVLIVLSVIISTRYFWWRYTSTLNLSDPLSAFFGIALILTETFSWVVLILGYVQTAWPLNRQPVALPKDTSTWPVVDLMITTYNEDLAILRPAVFAALGIDWPKDKLRIFLLDDGHRDEFRQFAEEVGIHYLIRPDNKHAKAGNLNHALKHIDGEFIAIFDCDHIPTRSFLQVTMGLFLKDIKLALVQTPHHFFSPDPFERNLGLYRQQPNDNTLFYGLVQNGNDLWDAAFFCGSCAVLSRSAIESIGGFAVETVTEDAHTALRLHRKGYTTAYLNIPQAAGLATESLSAHIGQRIRWARGMVQIFRIDNPLLGKGLSFFQRLCYTNAMLGFLSGIPRLVYLTAPLTFLVFHVYILYASALAIFLFAFPHILHSVITNAKIQGAYRRTFWGEIYETVLCWYIARPTTVALFSPKKGIFNVTAKGGLVDKPYFDWDISVPYVVLIALNLLGFFFGVWRLSFGPVDEIPTILLTMVWVIYNLVLLGCAIAVATEVRQVRKTHRVITALPTTIQLSTGHSLPVVLTDFSEGGAAIKLSSLDGQLKVNDCVQLIIGRGERRFSFPTHITRAFGTSMSLQFEPLTQQQHIDLIQCTFARADSWLLALESFAKDKTTESFKGVLLTSYHGYQHAMQYLPPPLNFVMRCLKALFVWFGSFLPITQAGIPDQKSLQLNANGVPHV